MIETEEKCSECGAPYMKGDIEEPCDDLCPSCRGVEAVIIEASDAAVAGVVEQMKSGGRHDSTVTTARISASGQSDNGPYVVIAWETKSAGFGELTFHHINGALHIDTEAMGPQFVAEVLVKLLENAAIT